MIKIEDICYITGDIGNPFKSPKYIHLNMKDGSQKTVLLSECDTNIKKMFSEFKHSILFNPQNIRLLTKSNEIGPYAVELSKSIVKSYQRNLKINEIISEKEN
jgi:hypothetical protein